MRALILEVDECMLAERSRLGLDHRDEMWEGVLHMVPPASERHQSIGTELLLALSGSAKARGWKLVYEVGTFQAAEDYRVPDLCVYAPEAASERGVEGAPIVVGAIRSPGD